MRQKISFIFLLLIPIVYLLFILKYIPSNNSNFNNLNKFFGANIFENTPSTKNVFNFQRVVFYDYKVPILMYHYVEYNENKEDFKRDQLNIEPHIFEQQIETFIKNNYKFITADELTTLVKSNKATTDKYVVLTFDDGYRDFYTDVLPILKKYNVKATLYIIYNFLDKENYLYKWQVDEIIETKLVEIGSHTLNHMYLKGTNQGMVTDEIVTSKSEIEKTFNIKVNSFAYPYGAYNDFAVQQVETSKYTNAITTDLGIIANKDNLFELKRIRPGYNTNQSLINLIEGLKDN